ncbi:MAG: histidine kinase [Marmoricola sp.]
MSERRFWSRVDLALGVWYAVLAGLILLNESSTGIGAALALVGSVTFGASIGWRRRQPIAWVAVLAIGTVVCQMVEPRATSVALAPLVLVLYSAAAQSQFGWGVAAVGAAVTAAWLTALPDLRHLGAVALFVPAYLVSWTLGLAANLQRRDLGRRLAGERRLRQAEVERAELELARVRLNIARELHDVVAHGISLITVQAGFGGLVVGNDTEATRSALSIIEVTGRQTLIELRQLLTVLRQSPDPATAAPASPAAGLDDLAQLAASLEAAGLTVCFDSEDPSGLEPMVQLTAYRIIQEALTNVLRHSEANHATVTMRRDDAGLCLTIRDAGATATPPGTVTPIVAGHGLLGMRERAASMGGRLTASPMPGGGFQVTCHLPIPGARLVTP